jgi:glycosyltransferase involved in cell wall biosynthesis
LRVSVIATVLNEGDSIRGLLDSLLDQTRSPDEVVIVDGGSTDDTVQLIESYFDRLPVRVLVAPGCNISQGRNRAVAAATGGVIASTDAGVRLVPAWLAELTRPFESGDRSANVVSGFFLADPCTVFEVAMGVTVLPTVGEIDPEDFLPSSRSVAFSRQAWQAVGGYPEWLDYSEDLVFDLSLRELCGPFAWAPRALARFRPRGRLQAYSRQYYCYARGDGKADLWRKRHAVRYATYLIALPGLLYLGFAHRIEWLLPLCAGIVAHCWIPWLRLRMVWNRLTWLQRLQAGALVPVIRAVGDVAKMVGYPVGWAWRLRNWARAEIHWRDSLNRTDSVEEGLE